MDYSKMSGDSLVRLYDRIVKRLKAAEAKGQIKAAARHQAALLDIRIEDDRRLKRNS